MDPSKQTATGTGAKLGLSGAPVEGTAAAVEEAKKNAPIVKASHEHESDYSNEDWDIDSP